MSIQDDKNLLWIETFADARGIAAFDLTNFQNVKIVMYNNTLHNLVMTQTNDHFIGLQTIPQISLSLVTVGLDGTIMDRVLIALGNTTVVDFVYDPITDFTCLILDINPTDQTDDSQYNIFIYEALQLLQTYSVVTPYNIVGLFALYAT